MCFTCTFDGLPLKVSPLCVCVCVVFVSCVSPVCHVCHVCVCVMCVCHVCVCARMCVCRYVFVDIYHISYII